MYVFQNSLEPGVLNGRRETSLDFVAHADEQERCLNDSLFRLEASDRLNQGLVDGRVDCILGNSSVMQSNKITCRTYPDQCLLQHGRKRLSPLPVVPAIWRLYWHPGINLS